MALGRADEAIFVNFDAESGSEVRKALGRLDGGGEHHHVEVFFADFGGDRVFIADTQTAVGGGHAGGPAAEELRAFALRAIEEAVEAFAVGTEVHGEDRDVLHTMIDRLVGVLDRVHAAEARAVAIESLIA